jgi:hypothetical protein
MGIFKRVSANPCALRRTSLGRHCFSMPRIARVVAEGVAHHVTQRGKGCQQVFRSPADFALCKDLLRKGDVPFTANRPSTLLHPQLAVRAEAHQLQAQLIRLAVNEHEIRPDVAVPVVVPLSSQRVIETPARQRSVGGEEVHDLQQRRVQSLA